MAERLIEELWYKVHLLGEEYRKEVRAVVEEIAKIIAEEHEKEIKEIAEMMNVKIVLGVESRGTNPTDVYPCLYLILPTKEFVLLRHQLKEDVERRLSDWAYHARLIVDYKTQDMEDTIKPKIKVWEASKNV